MKKALGLLVITALLPLQCALAHPKMFSDLPLADAKAKAKKSSKFLLIDFTASWCGPCKRMDKTTWSDPVVEKWIADNAIAVQIDVDKEHAIAESLNVTAMPTLVMFKPTDQTTPFDRTLGYQTSKQLLDWLTNVKAGKTSTDVLTAKLKTVLGRGGQVEVDARYEAARAYAEAGKGAEATEQFVWLWNNIEKQFPPMVGVRSSYMAEDMAQLAAKYPPAREAFSKLRDAAEAANDRRDWVTLNDILKDQDKTLAWFDSAKSDPAQKAVLKKVDFQLERLLISRERWADVANFVYPDPIAELESKHKFAEMVRQSSRQFNPGREYNPFPKDAGLIYASYLAAGNDAQADKIVEKSLQLEDSPDVRLGLVSMALRANQIRPSQIALLKADTPMTHQLLGSIHTTLRQYESSIEEFTKAIKANPKDTYSLAQRAAAYGRLKKYDLAKTDLDQALSIDPNDALVHSAASDLYSHQGKFQDALDAANRAKTLDPRSSSNFCNAGEALFGLGKYEEALADFNKSIQLNPRACAGEDYFYRAKTYEKLGKPDLAAEDLAAAKKLGYVPEEK